jgi:hypothetical protein
VALVVQVVQAAREDSLDFPVDPVVQVVQVAREDVAGVAGALQAVEHLTRRKSLK